MKKLIFNLIFGLMIIFSFSSCGTAMYTTTQEDIYVEAQTDVVRQSNIDFNIVIRYGTPYYYNRTLLYYLYNNLYYYPFYYNNYWYVRVYRKPFNHVHYRPYFRPNKYDYRFKPGYYRNFDRPREYRHRPTPSRPSPQPRINNGHRNNVGVPHTPRPTNRNNGHHNNRRFGGRR